MKQKMEKMKWAIKERKKVEEIAQHSHKENIKSGRTSFSMLIFFVLIQIWKVLKSDSKTFQTELEPSEYANLVKEAMTKTTFILKIM